MISLVYSNYIPKFKPVYTSSRCFQLPGHQSLIVVQSNFIILLQQLTTAVYFKLANGKVSTFHIIRLRSALTCKWPVIDEGRRAVDEQLWYRKTSSQQSEQSPIINFAMPYCRHWTVINPIKSQRVERRASRQQLQLMIERMWTWVAHWDRFRLGHQPAAFAGGHAASLPWKQA